jgi:hypothetical protein
MRWATRSATPAPGAVRGLVRAVVEFGTDDPAELSDKVSQL